MCDHLSVLAPRPYVPPGLAILPRWKSYARIKGSEVRNGISIHRPLTPLIPKVGSALWADLAPFFFSLNTAKKLHRSIGFDAIISFDIIQAGGIAWRMGKHLGIPAAGWAFGSDLRHSKGSPLGGVAARAVKQLDLVFYQSHELLLKAADLLNTTEDRMSGARHIILPHGIPEPPAIARRTLRDQIRSELRVREDETLLLYTGRIVVKKGLLELLAALEIAIARKPNIRCVMLGSHRSYDETTTVEQVINKTALLKHHVQIVPACSASKVWEYLCAADIFVFPSHNEGMPNSLLEAMAMGLPAVAFAIPALADMNDGEQTILLVPPLDVDKLSDSILRLVECPEAGLRLGAAARRHVMDRYMVKKNMSKALNYLRQAVLSKKTVGSSTGLGDSSRVGVSV